MMLFVNDIQLDLFENTSIARTKQVNNILTLSNRQSNYTQKIKVPKTKNNVLALDNLFNCGNISTKPYQYNKARLLNDYGLNEIENGYAIVFESTDEYYTIAVYDGLISFMKLIENKTLTDVGLAELNHLKNIQTVVDTWNDATLPYRYNLADYNGNTIYNTSYFNIDYLIPSVSVEYLWNKIFDYIGWTYEGSVFNLEDFKKLWLTYPKTIGDATQQTNPVHLWQFNGSVIYQATNPFLGLFQYSSYLTHNPVVNNSQLTSNTNDTSGRPDGSIITAVQAGLYKFTFDGAIGMEVTSSYQGGIDIIAVRNNGTPQPEILFTISNVENFQQVNATYYVNFEAGESFAIYPTPTGQTFGFFGANNRVVGNMDINVDEVIGNAVDFEEAFIKFSIKDFVNEIMVRFALTPFTDPVSKNIKFLTLNEIIQNDDVEDWTLKFNKKVKEKYIYRNYARQNHFKYKYNDTEDDHNDSFIAVDNINLKDQSIQFNSNIYSPEKRKRNILGKNLNVYRFWNREIKEDGSVEYKDLDNRFYFMKSEIITQSIDVGSEVFATTQSNSVYAEESFDGLSWNKILNTYYPQIQAIINRTNISTCEIKFNKTDFKNIALEKPIYLQQEKAYFLINQIKNASEKKPLTDVDLIKLEFDFVDNFNQLTPRIIISSSISEPLPPFTFVHNIVTNYSVLDYIPNGATIYMKQFDAHPDDGGVPTGFQYTGVIDLNLNVFAQPLPLFPPHYFGWYEVQIIDDNGFGSNIVYVYWGDSTTTNPTPNIEVNVEILGTLANTDRELYYRFNNFTPNNALLKLQMYDIIGQQNVGVINSLNLTQLTADTLHTLTNPPFPPNFGFVRVIIETDTITFNEVRILQ